jgi:hypothetical protein
MSVLALGVVLGLLIALFMKAKWVRPVPGLVCIAFGVLLAAGPAGRPIVTALSDAGDWVSSSLLSL